MKYRLLLTILLAAALARPAGAGIIFGRKGKKPPTPAERVPELIVTVKTDGDENKRAKAAEELRQYDPAAFKDIVPVLIDVLLNDKKPAVRAEAAQSLGKLRPVSQQAGMALEQALAKDPSMRVRLQARSSLLQYHWAGYHGGKKEGTAILESKEPPLADPHAFPPAINTTSPPPAGERLVPQAVPTPPAAPSTPTPLPPPAQTREPPTAPSAPAGTRPLPPGPPPSQAPAPPAEGKGPELE
jgi:hypothetical protein